MNNKYLNKKAFFTSITLLLFIFLIIFKDNIRIKGKNTKDVKVFHKYKGNNIILSYKKKDNKNIFMTIKNK